MIIVAAVLFSKVFWKWSIRINMNFIVRGVTIVDEIHGDALDSESGVK